MKQRQQILHIHGGNPDMGYQEYIQRLKTGYLNLNNKDSKKWNKRYREFLKEENYEIILPMMPCGWRARYDEWVIWFERHIEFMNNGIIFAGHSLGGNFLGKYLSENILPIHIKQLHIIAPSYSAFEDDFKITEFPNKFFENKIDEIHIYHSSDDGQVPILESEKYYEKIPNAHFHRFTNRGHFLGETFPELFENIKCTTETL